MSKLDKYKYIFLKELELNEDRLMEGEEIVIPSAEDYELNKESYARIILNLNEEDLAKIEYATANGLPSIIISANITIKGKQFLRNNSAWSKLYRGLKEIKEFISGI